jgi:hypothetical protein
MNVVRGTARKPSEAWMCAKPLFVLLCILGLMVPLRSEAQAPVAGNQGESRVGPSGASGAEAEEQQMRRRVEKHHRQPHPLRYGSGYEARHGLQSDPSQMVDRPEQPDRIERVERVDRPETIERPTLERVERPEADHHGAHGH